MARAPARYYRGIPCCGGAPVWNDPYTPTYPNGLTWGGLYTPNGGPLTADEIAAIDAIEGYGGTYKGPVSDVQVMAPMDHYNTDWNTRNGPVMMHVYGGGWVGPFNRNVPRITSAQQVPSLPNPDAGPTALPAGGPPHAALTRDYLTRERVRATPTEIRAVWDEVAGKHRAQILWCDSCGPDDWQSMAEGLSAMGESMIPVVRGIAAVCSYVPVFGTAVSFVLSVAMNLAEGMRVDQSVISAIGAALPGQPVSGMAFNAAVAIIEGESVNSVIINALPEPPTTPVIKQALVAASDVMIDVANGKTITNAALDELSKNLPPRAAQVMDIARRLANGENVQAVAISVMGKEAADAMTHAAVIASQSGGGAVSRFVSEAGFQAVMDTLPQEMRDGFQAGFTAGIAKKTQEMKGFDQGFTIAETNVPVNDSFAVQGQKIVAAGAKFGSETVAALLAKPTFNVTVNHYDVLNRVYQQLPMVFTINKEFLRGFMIAMGACNGKSADDSNQEQILVSLGTEHAKNGFSAGQAVQFWRTKFDMKVSPIKQTSAMAKVATLQVAVPLSQRFTIASPVLAKPLPAAIAAPRTAPIAIPADVYAQKTADRQRWVDYYKKL